ncbi:MAG: DUF4174 domain-containing protein [Paracoccus sp. (in: a-proteobacteria)]|uniref:DUF4174 domain-containing protein n=1 Tax=Paracoccus sp. TaxID=267 RepID=UPI0026E1051A|nr:DUF4174 domain-containing protein [Paracoccus sp. (in: a-proteobacteria)]MDO5622677.1 DUF4174 domain-containing protein [Paracoccus sp. (in: a-proteobacteria)]
MKNNALFLLVVPLIAAMGAPAVPPVPRPQNEATPDSSQVRVPPALPVEALVPRAALPVLRADEVTPEDFLWKSRPLVIFAATPDDPAFIEQMRQIEGNSGLLVQRDVVVITDTDPAGNSIWRQNLRPSGFSLVVIDKDGQVKQRKPAPWSVREITRAIDKFPLRRQEIGRGSVMP